MRLRFMALMGVLPAAVALSATVSQAQTLTPANSRDLSGVWQFFLDTPGQGLYGSASKEGPAGFTPWGKEQFDANKPSYGPRTVPFDNDPIQQCRPVGVPRILFYLTPLEIVQTSDRMHMFFERDHQRREIWIDGRGHPKDPDPTWMGHSIGRWDGDTLVIDSVGFNDRAWLDFFGYPRSEQLHLTERWRRTDNNTLTLRLTVDDPGAYTKPWESDTKIYKRLLGDRAVIQDLPCVTEDEEAFTKKLRNPARGLAGQPGR